MMKNHMVHQRDVKTIMCAHMLCVCNPKPCTKPPIWSQVGRKNILIPPENHSHTYYSCFITSSGLRGDGPAFTSNSHRMSAVSAHYRPADDRLCPRIIYMTQMFEVLQAGSLGPHAAGCENRIKSAHHAFFCVSNLLQVKDKDFSSYLHKHLKNKHNVTCCALLQPVVRNAKSLKDLCGTDQKNGLPPLE